MANAVSWLIIPQSPSLYLDRAALHFNSGHTTDFRRNIQRSHCKTFQNTGLRRDCLWKMTRENYREKTTRLGYWYNARMSFVRSVHTIHEACVYVGTFLRRPSCAWRFKRSVDTYRGQRKNVLAMRSTFENFMMIIGPPKRASSHYKVSRDPIQFTRI